MPVILQRLLPVKAVRRDHREPDGAGPDDRTLVCAGRSAGHLHQHGRRGPGGRLFVEPVTPSALPHRSAGNELCRITGIYFCTLQMRAAALSRKRSPSRMLYGFPSS